MIENIEFEDKKAHRVKYKKRKKKKGKSGSLSLKLYEPLGDQVETDVVHISRESVL